MISPPFVNDIFPRGILYEILPSASVCKFLPPWGVKSIDDLASIRQWHIERSTKVSANPLFSEKSLISVSRKNMQNINQYLISRKITSIWIIYWLYCMPNISPFFLQKQKSLYLFWRKNINLATGRKILWFDQRNCAKGNDQKRFAKCSNCS